MSTDLPEALRALLREIVDYAGLFPPAGLPLEEAIANYLRYREGEGRWMLGRFVIPVRRLSTLDPFADGMRSDGSVPFSVLGSGGDDADAFMDALAEDLDAIRVFHDAHGEYARVESMEVRLPGPLLDQDSDIVQHFLEQVADDFAAAELATVERFYEVPVGAQTRGILDEVLPAVKVADADQPTGLKMRLGGTEPGTHPEPQHVAPIITLCERHGVRFKATAGLHHPLRHDNAEAGEPMHGFLNVFGASVLCRVHELDEATVLACLQEREASHFRFEGGRFAWQEHEVTAEQIAEAREFATSFGSCSFEEPREDLRGLGLL